jgi:hypothetical protein
VTGRRPPSSDAPQKLLNPKHADNPPPSIIKPGLDPRLEKILQKCLARNEQERYADGHEVAQALRAWRPVRQAPHREKWVVLIGVVLIGLLLGRWAVGKWSHGTPGVVDPAPADLQPPPDPLNLEAKTIREFIRDGWAPEPYFWRLGESDGTLQPKDARKPLTLYTNFRAVVEYLPAADRDVVQVAAKLRVNSGPPKTSQVGVYVGGMPVQTTKGEYLALIEASFCDKLDESKAPVRTGMVRLTAWLIRPVIDGPLQMAQAHFGELIVLVPQQKTGADELFHDLKLELTRDWVRAWFDGKFVAEKETKYVNEALTISGEKEMGNILPKPINFLPSGGAGLYVSEANASYERFRAGPAPQRLPE